MKPKAPSKVKKVKAWCVITKSTGLVGQPFFSKKEAAAYLREIIYDKNPHIMQLAKATLSIIEGEITYTLPK